jgi:acetolactate synthase-1/2/3 large subunit
VKIFIINNQGYHQIRQTQTNMFHDGFVGIGPDSGDLGFPDFSKVADAFGYQYLSIRNNSEMPERIDEFLNKDGAGICEVFVSTTQKFEPKSAAKRLPDGRIVSPPLEDMAPFLSREELEKNMCIPLVDEE